MKARAVIRLHFSSDEYLNVVFHSLEPETLTSSTTRSKVSITVDNHYLVFNFKANDTSALRAAINSYLRLIDVAMSLRKFSDL